MTKKDAGTISAGDRGKADDKYALDVTPLNPLAQIIFNETEAAHQWVRDKFALYWGPDD